MKPFHYAFKVKDISSTRKFYVDILGCTEGRSTETWIDFNFFGHQLSAHISNNFPPLDYCGTVDGVRVPIPHFGCIVDREAFHRIEARLAAEKIECIVPSQLRYAGEAVEQYTLFVLDYSGNALEFKSFSHADAVFLK